MSAHGEGEDEGTSLADRAASRSHQRLERLLQELFVWALRGSIQPLPDLSRAHLVGDAWTCDLEFELAGSSRLAIMLAGMISPPTPLLHTLIPPGR